MHFKKFYKSTIKKFIESTGILFSAALILATVVYAVTWAPGLAPQAAPEAGNVELIWDNDGTNVFRESGNVGIGTTTPGQKLSVAGTIESTTGGVKFPDGTTQTTAGGGSAAETLTDAGSHAYYTEGPVHIGSTSKPRYDATFEASGKAMFAVLGVRTDPSEGGYVMAAAGGSGTRLGWPGVDVEGTKNFKIDHPLDPDNKWLYHSTLEGPEVGVYYRGEAQLESGETLVVLPDYFEALTSTEGRTVILSNVGGFDKLAVKLQDGQQVKDGTFIVYSDDPASSQRFTWEVTAVRKIAPPFFVEKAKPKDE